MTKINFDTKKLREASVVYLAMTKIDLAFLTPGSIKYNLTDLKNRLLPVMHQQSLPRKLLDLKSWARTMVVEFRQALNNILLLKSNEIAFIEAVRKEGKIIPELITDNAELAQKIALHHLLNLTPI